MDQLTALCDLARRAGAAVMSIYGGETQVWQKDDRSPVTNADYASDAIIREALIAAWPTIPVVSEEALWPDHEKTGRFFLVDPLDGTKEFLTRNGEFTINIALVEEGRSIAGVVYAPALDEIFFASTSIGAWKRDAASGPVAITVAPFAADRPLRVMGSRSHGGAELQRWLQSIAIAHELVSAGSSLKLCRVAEGAADVYPRFGSTSQWDTAAGQCVVEQAGGVVVAMGGGPITYGLDQPILNPHFAAVGDPRVLALLDSPMRELA